MNKGNGVKQPRMRDGYYTPQESNRIIQRMTVEPTDEPKGLQMVREEQKLWPKCGLSLGCTLRKSVTKEKRNHSGDKC